MNAGHTETKRASVGIGRVLRASTRAWSHHLGLAMLSLSALIVQQVFTVCFGFWLGDVVKSIAHDNTARLEEILIRVVIGFAVMIGATLGGERLVARAGTYLVNDIRRDMFAGLLRASTTELADLPPGLVGARFGSDVRTVETGFTTAYLGAVRLVIGLLVMVPILFHLNWVGATVLIASMGPLAGITHRLARRSLDADSRNRRTEIAVAERVQEALLAAPVVRAYGLEGQQADRFESALVSSERDTVQGRVALAAIGHAGGLAVLFVQLVVLFAAAASAHRISASGALFTFVTIVGVSAKDGYRFVQSDMVRLLAAAKSLTATTEMRTLRPAVTEAAAASLAQGRHAIGLRDLSYDYAPHDSALSGVTCDIAAGSFVAVVGTNASGKSTLLNTLLRFHDPTTGQVLIDGIDITTVPLAELRRDIGVVFQSNYVFNGSLYDNIAMGREHATAEAVTTAAIEVGLNDYVDSLPDGYATQVFDRHGRLSGGYRQRLALARALAGQPSILLLDEVTSALDPDNEADVVATIRNLAGSHTIVFVTHRLSCAESADQILVLDRGHLVEVGLHTALVDADGLYSRLWRKQSGFQITGDGRDGTVEPERLRQIALFEDLGSELLETIAGMLRAEHIDENTTVVAEGDEGDRLYLIARGQVTVTALGPDGEQHEIDALSDGDHFGEMALLLGKPRSATVTTRTPSLFLTLSRQQLLDLVDAAPEIDRALRARLERSEANLAKLRASTPADQLVASTHPA